MHLCRRAALLSLAACSLSIAQGQVVDTPKPIPQSVPLDIRNTNQFRRFWHLYGMRADPSFGIPGDVLEPAARVMNREIAVPPPAAVRAPAGSSAAAVPALVGNRWKSLGPAPILYGQIGRYTGTRAMSGRATAVAVDPTNNNRWFIGGAQGGIWETTNAGATWVARTDRTPSMATGAIAIAKSNPRIIYVGTGELANSSDAYGGQGLLKSVDGGLNWTLVSTHGKFGSYGDLWVDPSNPNILLAANGGGVFGRNYVGTPEARPLGVYRSTMAA